MSDHAPTLLALALVLGCAGCATGPVSPPSAADDLQAAGANAVERRNCASCHDPGDGSLSGQTAPMRGTTSYGTNLTPDPDTGIGNWTDEEIVRALRYGLDDQRQALCATMPRYADLGTREAEAIVAYLRGLAPTVREIPISTCAPPDEPDGGADVPADLALAPDLGVAPDLAAAAPDLARAVDAEPPTDLSPANDLAPRACGVRINEVQTAGAGGNKDQFVELYNPCPSPIALDGASLVYRSAAGTKDVGLVGFAPTTLAAGAFLVCGQTHFGGQADVRFGAQLSAAGGGLALRDGGGAIVDAVGWGNAKDAFVVGRPAGAPAAERSIGRLPDGRDSGDSERDFPATAMPTPGRANR